ncbi:MAG: biotin--[acetyl-CoA-carboxylase] ligase [Gammaproteobacteria bacterium]|nr:biotin--[acetyl-CoA-carboxylase] ligase [Gammaproteobacteria bacterium]
MTEFSSSLPLDAERIAEALSEEVCARLGEIEMIDKVASTNDILYDDDVCNRVQVARHQTGGRGRQGRNWETADGALCFSVLHTFPAQAPAALALWAGIALTERLREMGLGQPCLNWPNDLMYGAEKFGGILTECRARGGQTRCVVGVGINVEDVPEVDRPATSIARACGQIPDPNHLAAGLIGAVSACLVRMDGGAPGELKAYFDSYDGLKGSEVHVTGTNQTYTGRALGVDDRGCLQVEGEEGVRRFDSADVRLQRR